MNGVDVHCHVLPGVDDGAPDIETSLAMLRMARAGGTSDVVATPHQHPGRYPNEPEALEAAHARLIEAIAARRAEGEELPDVHLGAEIHLDADLVPRILGGRRLRLAGGPWVLLELPDVFELRGIEDLVHRMQVEGLRPLLAHPERVGQLARHPGQMQRLVELGALGQATGSSIAGEFGAPCRTLTEDWLRRGLLHLVASDAHGLRRRNPDLSAARAAATALLGEDGARLLLDERPRAVLEGRDFEVEPPAEPEPERPGLLARLLRKGSRRDRR